MTDELTFDQIKERKKLPNEIVPIVLDGSWGQQVIEAQSAVQALEAAARIRPSDTSLNPQIDEATKVLDDLLAQRPEMVADFKFKGLGRDRYERLIKAHPPTKDQRTDAARQQRNVTWNEDTFPPALISACLISPKMTEAQVRELLDDDEWNEADCGALFTGAQQACLTRPVLQ